MPLKYVEPDLSLQLLSSDLDSALEAPVQKILELVKGSVSGAEIEPTHILFTGGSSKLSFIRKRITDLFDDVSVIECDEFEAVSLGLGKLAQERLLKR